jgi:TDG/mug DNA glycosylase family protein
VNLNRRPTKQDLEKARKLALPDLINTESKIWFCGINPSLYSAAVGLHFARPGNRFWPTLFRAGFTDQLLKPFEQDRLLKNGLGITNIVGRATANAGELTQQELSDGANELREKITLLRPRWIAFLGISAFRTGFGNKDAKVGRQDFKLGDSKVWVLPNPSGLNAHYGLDALAKLYGEFLRISTCG